MCNVNMKISLVTCEYGLESKLLYIDNIKFYIFVKIDELRE